MPIVELRGFDRLLLQPRERRTVSFRLTPSEAMAADDEARKAFAVLPGEYEIGAGASSRDIRATARVTVR